MQKQQKKKVWYILLGIIIITIILVTPVVKADSGFDASYGGGSSGGSSSSSGGDILEIIFYFIKILLYFPPWISIPIIIGIIVLTVICTKSSRTAEDKVMLNHKNEVSPEEILKILQVQNREVFLQERYQDYIDIQNAWTNFEYEKLRTKLTDELYNQYEMQLQTLKVKNEQNVMEDFNYIDSMITNIKEENNQMTVTMELAVSFYDYIVQNKQIVRGNKTQKIYMHYELVFVCNKTTPDICPHCGAKLTNKASQKCEYCGSIIAKVSKDWVLSKKEAKNQK